MSTKNDLFGDSSSEADTDDLIAAAKSQPIATKKKSSPKKKAQQPQPDADNDTDDDDDDDEDFGSPQKGRGGGLFDSSSEDEDAPKKKKKKVATKKKKAAAAKNKKKPSAQPKKKDARTMKEKMEELAKKKRQAANGGVAPEEEPRRKRSKPTSKNGGDAKEGEGDKKGYESGDSYDSTTFARTKEDDDFIDADDEDPEALKELYAEQHFDDERPDSDSEEDRKKKAASSSGKKKSSGGGGVDKISLSDDEEGPSGSAALKEAVRRMQRKKKEVKKLPQLEQEATDFLRKMDAAADADDESIAAKKPALKKLGMLSEVMEMLAQKDMQRVLLDLDLLMVCKRWVQPLPPDGKTLGNLTVRRRIIEALSNMTGENGINSQDLKRSGFGKVVMALFKHKSETPDMKKMLKAMIEQWSRPIFQKSGNLRDLERAQMVRGMNEMGSLVGIARHQAQQQQAGQKSAKARGRGGRATNEDDLAQIINTGSKNSADIGNNRVRVPYSKGFQFSVRPADRTGDVSDKRNLVSAKAARSSMGREGDTKESLQKRMLNKARPVNKQSQRSANISIEGRVVK